MLETAENGIYANMVSVLCVTQWIYLSLASIVASFEPELPFYFGVD
ncbi:MAG: hypothetical protein V7784_04690 [Oceanospirillaceae bacterium]